MELTDADKIAELFRDQEVVSHVYEAEVETHTPPYYHAPSSHAHTHHQHTAPGDQIKAEEVAGENNISSLKPTIDIDLHFQPPKINPFPITAPENNDFEENKKEIMDTDNTNGNSPDLNTLVKDKTEDVDDYEYYDFELINDINQRSNVSNEDYYLLLPTYIDEPRPRV